MELQQKEEKQGGKHLGELFSKNQKIKVVY